MGFRLTIHTPNTQVARASISIQLPEHASLIIQVLTKLAKKFTKTKKRLTRDEPVLNSAVIRRIDVMAAVVLLRGLIVGVRVLVEAGNEQADVEKVCLDTAARFQPIVGGQSYDMADNRR